MNNSMDCLGVIAIIALTISIVIIGYFGKETYVASRETFTKQDRQLVTLTLLSSISNEPPDDLGQVDAKLQRKEVSQSFISALTQTEYNKMLNSANPRLAVEEFVNSNMI